MWRFFCPGGAVSKGVLDVSPLNLGTLVQTGGETSTTNFRFEHVPVLELGKCCNIKFIEYGNLFSAVWKKQEGVVLSSKNFWSFLTEPITHYRYIGDTVNPTPEDVLRAMYVEGIINSFLTVPLEERYGHAPFMVTQYGTISATHVIRDPSQKIDSDMYLLLSDGTDGIYNQILNAPE